MEGSRSVARVDLRMIFLHSCEEALKVRERIGVGPVATLSIYTLWIRSLESPTPKSLTMSDR